MSFDFRRHRLAQGGPWPLGPACFSFPRPRAGVVANNWPQNCEFCVYSGSRAGGAPARQRLSCCRGTRVSLLVPTGTRGQGHGHMSLSWGEKAQWLLHLVLVLSPEASRLLEFHQPQRRVGASPASRGARCGSPTGGRDLNKALGRAAGIYRLRECEEEAAEDLNDSSDGAGPCPAGGVWSCPGFRNLSFVSAAGGVFLVSLRL